jgi:hypothetical protein
MFSCVTSADAEPCDRSNGKKTRQTLHLHKQIFSSQLNATTIQNQIIIIL